MQANKTDSAPQVEADVSILIEQFRSLRQTTSTLFLWKRSGWGPKLSSFIWFPELDVGWYPVDDEGVYGQSYFDVFHGYKTTEKGKLIGDFRVQLVKKYGCSDVLDIGIGAGQFVEQFGEGAKGYDVNQSGIHWLLARDKFVDPFTVATIENASFWDSLEHIHNFWSIVEKVTGHVFMTIPIICGSAHAMVSKHFKPHEHYWYFTRRGLIAVFQALGFELLEANLSEQQIGRQDVASFVFRRVTRS